MKPGTTCQRNPGGQVRLNLFSDVVLPLVPSLHLLIKGKQLLDIMSSRLFTSAKPSNLQMLVAMAIVVTSDLGRNFASKAAYWPPWDSSPAAFFRLRRTSSLSWTKLPLVTCKFYNEFKASSSNFLFQDFS